MKQIIFTVTNDLTYDQRMIRISTSLANHGYKVLLVGRLRENSKPLNEQPFQQKRLSCFFDKGKRFYLEYNIRLFLFLLRQKTDILGAIDLDTILPCLMVATLKRKVLVFDAHEYFTEVPEVVDRYWVKKVWQWVGDWAIPRAQYAYTVGECLGKIFTEKYKVPFEVIRNVPFAKKIEDQEEEGRKIILYQGVLNKGRGLEQAIQVMKNLEGAELWLAGEGDLSKVLRELVKELKLEDKVHFLGYLQPTELAKITPKAYIGLNLLENKGLSYYYSLANKAFDYIQAGVPSIQMNFPEYNALNDAFEVFALVENLEISSLTTAIHNLLNDASLHERLKENCKKAASLLNWEEEEKKLIQLYDQMNT